MQEFIVFLIVLAAVVYLARQYWPAKDKDAGCNSCAFHNLDGVAKVPKTQASTAARSSTPPRSSTPAGADGLIQINVNSAPRKKL